MILESSRLRWWHGLLCIAGGVAVTLSLSPYDLWPLAPVGLWLLAMALRGRGPLTSFGIALLFGLGLFASGASWVYVSIYTYGIPSVPVATALTAAFVTVLALVFALPWLAYPLLARTTLQHLIAFPALWLLGEVLRSWLFTGFPWLLVGYSQTDGPLLAWAPWIGALSIGALIAFSAAAIADLAQVRPGRFGKILYLAVVAAIWAAPWELRNHAFTEPLQRSLDVRLVQGNIPQSQKWNPQLLQANIDTYLDTTGGDWSAGLVVWPEAAIPLSRDNASYLIDSLQQEMVARNATLITGIPVRDALSGQHHNSLVALGAVAGEYHKQRLVPFGEYVPLRAISDVFLELFELPLADMAPGSPGQANLFADGFVLAPAICYEIAYAGLVSSAARDANVILTVSNDTWFGTSIGPHQHFQIARMRAVENGKPVIRATNNGITGVIDADGRVLDRLPQFTRAALDGRVQPRVGETPFNRFGDRWAIGIAAGLLVLSLAISAARR